MRFYSVIWQATASADLTAIRDWIAADAPERARDFILRLVHAVDDLQTMPRRGAITRRFKPLGRDVRSLPFSPYLILYTIKGREVHILRVRHSARGPMRAPAD